MSRASAYAPLADYLTRQPGEELALTFPTIETILGRPLPVAAWTTAAWWTGTGRRASHRTAWRRAGWEVAGLHLPAKVVTFRRLATLPQP